MEKKSIISSPQIVMILFITRLLFSTTYQSVLNAGNSIQDLLLSLPIVFITNFIIAIPMLILLKRYPGHDPVECATTVAGRGAGIVVAIFYYVFFILNAIITTGNFENYFTISVISEVDSYAIGFLILVICIYGALKGIEAMARFNSIAAVIYILTTAVICISVISLVKLNYLKPMLFNGTKYLMGSIALNYNLSSQIVMLAFLAPFLQKGKSIGKTYAIWNVMSVIRVFVLEFNIVTVTGAFGAVHQQPLQLLATLSQISVFDRVDSIDMVSWILNSVITITIYLYLAVSCLLKIGLNKHRKMLAIISGAIIFFISPYLSRNFIDLQSVIVSGVTSLVVTLFTVFIPIIILIADVIKGRVAQNVQKQ